MQPAGTVVYTKLLFLSNSMRECLSNNYFAVSQANLDTSLPFMEDMLNNHRKCPYWNLLKFFCASEIDRKKSYIGIHNKKRQKLSSSRLVKNDVVIHQVYHFLRVVSQKVIPLKAFGNKHNFYCFMRHVKKLLNLQMYGQISLDHMIDGTKTKSIAWMKSYSQTEKLSAVKKLIHFFITRFICPLIQSFFYVTGSTSCKNKLFFYRKKTWHSLSQFASNQFVKTCKLRKVPEHWVETKLREGKCLGVSNVRFLVKSSSLRPIVNLSLATNKKASVNSHLKALLHVLTFEKENNQQAFGATVMNTKDIHIKWRQFVTEYKQRQQTLSVQQLYFVKVDIEKCYDTINPCLLYSIVSRIVKRSSYRIYKYRRQIHNHGQNRSVYFESCQHPNSVCNSKANIDSCGSYVVAREVLLGKLCSLLFCNVCKVGKQHYVQTLGISQGSALSNILCGAYYGCMDQIFLNRVRSPCDFLVRMVDDMLYATPCLQSAKSLLRIFLDGIPEFNCRCNLNKCCASFSYHHAVFGDVPQVPGNSLIKFCGLAFHTQTLNVYIDFSNYTSIQTCEAVSWELTSHPGLIMRKKVMSFVHPKCLSILFDKDISLQETIYYNILCIFSVCAVKFHCLVKQLSPKRRVLSNPKFFTNIILDLPQILIASALKKLRQINSLRPPTFPVASEIVYELCLQSFLFKLQMHHNMYAPVIKRLQQVCGCELNKNISLMLPQVFQNIYIK